MKKTKLLLLLITAGFMLFTSDVRAQNSFQFTSATTYNWNTASNWSLGHVPTSMEDVTVTYTLTSNGAATVIINATNIAAKNLTITGSYGGSGKKILQIIADASSTTTLASITLSADGSSNANSEAAFLSDGIVNISGNFSVGETGNNLASYGASTGSPTYNWEGDVTIGPMGQTYYQGTYIFKGMSQLYTRNTTQHCYLHTVQIGNGGHTTVTLAGTNQDGPKDGDLTISPNATLVMPDGQLFNQAGSGAGATFTVSGTLILDGTTGGRNGSNFPKSIGSTILNPGSLVDYNGSFGSQQTIYRAPTYSNLTLSGGGTKIAGNSVSISGTVYITGAKTVVDDGGHTFGGTGTNLVMDGGRFKLSSFGSKPDMGGTYTLTGGVIEYANTNNTVQSVKSVNAASTSIGYQNVEITGSNVGNSNGNLTLNSDGTLVVKNGGAFTINADEITGTSGLQTVTVESGGLFKCGKADGFSGSATSVVKNDIETIDPQTGSTIEYTGGPAGTTNQTLSARTDYYNVTISGSSTKTMNGDVSIAGLLDNNSGNILAINNNTLSLNGTLTGTGTISGSQTSGLIIGGTSNSLYFTQSGYNNYLKILTVNPSAVASLANTLNMTASDGVNQNTFGIVIVNGSLDIGNNYLQLKSDQDGDAIIWKSTGTITGTGTPERYIPEHRAWRWMAVPVNNTQTINQAWQDSSVPFPSYNTLLYQNTMYNRHPGYGTDITYDGNTSNGFDVNTTNTPSLHGWVSATSDWTSFAPATATTQINAYPAYDLFVRGSRAIDLSQGIYAPPDNTVLRATGAFNMNTVTKTFTGIIPNKVQLVGNPYACPVDLSTVLDGSHGSGYTAKKFWVWDPVYSGTYGVGGYVAFSNGMQVPYNGLMDPIYTAGTVIQSSQAFMVESDGGTNLTVQFTQDDKSMSESPNVFGRPVAQTKPRVYVNVRTADIVSSLIDGIGAEYGKNYADSIDASDTQKKWNTTSSGSAVGISFLHDDQYLAIDFRKTPVLSDTLFLHTELAQSQYTLQVFSENLSMTIPNSRMWLVDTYLKTPVPLSIDSTTYYVFTVDSNAASSNNRFMIVWRRQFIATPIPVTRVTSSTQTANNESNARTMRDGTIKVFPNPAADYIFVKGFKVGTDILLTDAKGKVMNIIKVTSTTQKIYCSSLANGVYFLKTEGATLKFVKQK